MKRALSLILALNLLLTCCGAFAVDLDYSTYTDEELAEIIQGAQTELQSRYDAARPTDSSQFIYSSNGQEIQINSYIGTDADVVIPAEIDGLPVTRVKEGAFRYNETIRSVVIPDTVTVIDTDTFSGCPNLASVIFPKHLRYISSFAFSYSLSGILNLPSSLEVVSAYAFSGAHITGLIINSNLEDNDGGKGAFSDLKALKFVYIREGCNPTFTYEAFSECPEIEIVIIPASATDIPYYLFEGSERAKIIAPAGSYAASWAMEHFIPLDTENYASYVEEYNALYPIP